MAYITLYTNLPRHDKLLQFQSLLRISTPQAVGHLCLLWIWTLENSSDGSLRRLDARGLAQICQFNQRRAEEFQSALLLAGFLDQRTEGLVIHDWDDYGGRYTEMRTRARERKRRQRSRGTSGTVTDIDESRCDASRCDESNLLSSGAGGDGVSGRGQVEDFLSRQGLAPSETPGTDAALLAECGQLTGEIFRRFCARPPTELDRGKVFNCVTRLGEGGRRALDPDGRELLLYAFQQAAQAGRPGNWPYIEGVLGRLHQRGIGDLDAAEDYDYERIET